MLYLIGLGLSWKDLSMKALEALNNCEEVYLETYTSISDFTLLQLQRLLGKIIRPLDRKQVEEELPFLAEAAIKNVALLIYGDPLAATTHQEILHLARKRNIKTKVIHAPSIFTAIAETGLSLYRFGKVASIPMPEKGFEPESFFDVLKENLSTNAHTLFLLDLKPEQNKFLTIPEAIKQLLEISKRQKEAFHEDSLVIGCARLGFENSIIKAGTAKEIMKIDFGNPPYCLIVPAKLNHKEQEYIEIKFDKATPNVN
ncbi:MAG: diphthine synthase [Candidatus Nanoarchaeia archaeon]